MKMAEKGKSKEKQEYETLCARFVLQEERKGRRSTRKLPYELGPFFLFCRELEIAPGELSVKQAQEYQTRLATMEKPDGTVRYASQTVGSMTAAARRFCGFLKTEKLAGSNPFASVRPIRTRKKLPRDIPEETKLAELLDLACGFDKEPTLSRRRNLYKIHVIAELLYATGMRICEAAGLRAEDINLEGRTIRITDGKAGRERTAYAGEYAMKIIGLYLREMRDLTNRSSEYGLFGVKDGKAFEAMVNRWLKALGRRCGIDRFTSHSFRHAVGFHLLRRGCDMRFIQLILGHEDMRATSVYTKVVKTDLRNELDACHPRKFKTKTDGKK
jgi:site-specific recombinase XerD